MRQTFYWDKDEQKFVELIPTKAKVEVPSIRTDEIPPTESMIDPIEDKKVFTSRAKLHRHYKEHGYEVTGGDHIKMKSPEAPKPDQREIREDAEKAYHDIKYDKVQFTEKEKQLWKEEQRKEQAWAERNWHLSRRRA